MKRASNDQLDTGEFDYLRIKRTRIIAPATSNIDLTLPSISGTLAVTSQIPSPASFVDLSSQQTISGIKTFLSSTFRLNSPLQIGTTSGNVTTDAAVINFPGAGGLVALDLPVTSGTLALISDITGSSLFVDLTSNQNISGVKNFISGPTAFAGVNINGACTVQPSGQFFITNSSNTGNNRLFCTTVGPVVTTLPNTSGTLAQLADIPTSANYVDLTTNQSVGGIKTFTSTPSIPGGYVDVHNTQTVSGGKTFTNTPSLSDGVGTRFIKLQPVPTNFAGTNTLNLGFNSAASGKTHTLQLGDPVTTVANTTWILDANGGNIPNLQNSQSPGGGWNFTGTASTSSTGTTCLSVRPSGVQPLSGANNYFWTTLGVPPTTGGTTGNLATLTVNGPPVNTGDDGINTNAICASTGSIRATLGAIIAGNGSTGAPAIRMGSLATDLSTGFYRPATQQIAAVCNGGAIMTLKATTPHVAITGDTTTTGSLRIGTLGSTVTTLQQGSFSITASFTNASSTSGGFTFSPSFGASTPIVLITLRNSTGNASSQFITAQVTSISPTQFTVTLTNPTNNNVVAGVYVINWIAMV